MLSYTEYNLRTIDCEFTFDECNNFCEKDTLKTLVTETLASEETDVKIHPFSTDNVMLLFDSFYKVEPPTPIFVVKPE